MLISDNYMINKLKCLKKTHIELDNLIEHGATIKTFYNV